MYMPKEIEPICVPTFISKHSLRGNFTDMRDPAKKNKAINCPVVIVGINL